MHMLTKQFKKCIYMYNSKKYEQQLTSEPKSGRVICVFF